MAAEDEYLKDLSPLNQLQFAEKDYPNYFDALLRRIREQYGADYNDFGSSSVGVMLTNITAYGLSQLAWYLDRTANDCFLETARTLDAVTKLARQIGYKPNPAAASTADLAINCAATAAPSTISDGFRFAGPDGLTFLATSAVLVPSGTTSFTVNVTEGSQRTVNFTGTGAANQIYNLTGVIDGKYAADLSVRVFVNGLEWTEQDFITFEATNQFEVSYTTTPPTVIFGDGFAGNIPALGSAIAVSYRIISGSAGNVKSGTIKSATDVFVVAGNPVPLTVNNPQGSSGGSEPESIAQIKAYAPKYYLSRGAAVTQEDYISLAQNYSSPTYGSVSVAYAKTIRDNGVDAETQVILDQITADLNAFNSSFSAESASLTATSDGLAASSALINTNTAAITAASANLVTANNSTSANSQSGLGFASAAVGAFTEIDSTADQALTELALANYATVANLIYKIKSIKNDGYISAATCSSLFNTIRNAATANTLNLNSLTAASGVLSAQSSSISGYATAIVADISDIEDTAATLDAAYLASQSQLVSHLIGLFSSNCEANVVNVPILVKDSEGFYTGPSSGLINSLQSYFDGIKDVTHSVRVVNGASLLIYADIVTYVNINFGFVASEVLANIEFGFNSILKNRKFATPLYLSDLYAITNQISGIDNINIEITAPTNRLDAYGNLVPQDLEIVTRGTVTITQV
jgi:hypothetical protein